MAYLPRQLAPLLCVLGLAAEGSRRVQIVSNYNNVSCAGFSVLVCKDWYWGGNSVLTQI